MENTKELFIDIIRIDKNKRLLTLASKDFIYSEDVSDKNTGEVAKEIQERESEDNKSDVKPLERIIYEKNFWLQNNSDSTGYILAQYNSLKNIIVNAIHFKKHILLDGNLIRGMGKSQTLADLSAAYQLPVLTFLDKQPKQLKNKNENSMPMTLSQWNRECFMSEKETIILVDDIPRAEALKLVNDGYIVIGFVI